MIKSIEKGFTMAECLVTIGVIGVVAAMTLPVMIERFQEVVLRAKWKAVYSKISNAFLLVKGELSISDYKDLFRSDSEMSEILTLMRKKLIVEASQYKYICEQNSACQGGGGTLKNYKTLFGTKMNSATFSGYADSELSGKIIWRFPDNSVVYFRQNTYYDMFVIYLFVDVNGVDAPPNTLGKDFFALVLTPKGACPIGANCGYRPQYFKNSCNGSREFRANSLNGMHSGAVVSGIGCSAEELLK